MGTTTVSPEHSSGRCYSLGVVHPSWGSAFCAVGKTSPEEAVGSQSARGLQGQALSTVENVLSWELNGLGPKGCQAHITPFHTFQAKLMPYLTGGFLKVFSTRKKEEGSTVTMCLWKNSPQLINLSDHQVNGNANRRLSSVSLAKG